MSNALAHDFSYSAPSRAALSDDGGALWLATSGGSAPHPRLFCGELPAPGVQAAALLTVARCARSRYFDPAKAVLADPVVTCHADRLRFEALSSCAGVYARHDVDLGAADGDVARVGVTNVDINEETRVTLARMLAGSVLLLDIGEDGVGFATDTGAAFERRVDLPVRWVKGFGEVGALSAELQPVAEIHGALAQRFLRNLPVGGSDLWLTPAAREPRWSGSSSPGAIRVAGPQRLKLLAPLTRFVRALRVWGDEQGVSAWMADFGDAGRLTLMITPAISRGFSGEGATLSTLAAERLQPLADAVSLELAWQPALSAATLAARLDRPVAEVEAALPLVAARGRAGFDLHDGAFFHRDLPYDLEQVEALHPRLRDARRLVADGRIELEEEGREAWVRSPNATHRVRLTDDPPTCTCDWWLRHRGARGPCKHVLAAELARDGG